MLQSVNIEQLFYPAYKLYIFNANCALLHICAAGAMDKPKWSLVYVYNVLYNMDSLSLSLCVSLAEALVLFHTSVHPSTHTEFQPLYIIAVPVCHLVMFTVRMDQEL